jgi:hypothetical protein
VIARAIVAAVALAAAVVLAADLHSARRVDAAVAAAAAPGRLDAAIATLRDVARGTSDTAPLLNEVQLLLAKRDYRAAQATALAAARREPDNARAWLLVGLAAGGSGDRAVERDARARIGALVARP